MQHSCHSSQTMLHMMHVQATPQGIHTIYITGPSLSGMAARSGILGEGEEEPYTACGLT